ncbi:MAG: hypothetical protein ACR2QG_03620, partial [Gammaproteobacteria bacterium]
MKLLQNKLIIGLLILFAVISSVYWQDPWLWRNYLRFFTTGDRLGIEKLPPDEEVRGDKSLVLPVAAPAERTITPAALEAMHAYAKEFDSHALITVHKGVIQDEWYGDHWQADYLTQSQSMHKSLLG